jgi:fibronectin-binding autotransporter adhesin
MRLLAVLALVAVVVGFGCVSAYGQTNATWTNTNGNWSNGASWSTNPTVPSNGSGTFYNVVINGTGSDTITFDLGSATINSLTLGTGETFQDNGFAPTLTIGDPAFPAAGSLTNSGTINWGSGANLTLDITAGNGSIINNAGATINLTNSSLTFNDHGNGNTATLSGGGTINLSGATITGQFGDETLNNVDNTISGEGIISNLNLVNNGTINAAGLVIRGGFTNNGTVNAVGPTGITINTAGYAPLSNSGTVNINGSLKVNGDFDQTNSGVLALTNSSAGTITGSLNGGTTTVDSSTLSVQGNFGGSLNLSANQNISNVNVQGNFSGSVTFKGGENISNLNVGGNLSTSSLNDFPDAIGNVSVAGTFTNNGAVFLETVGLTAGSFNNQGAMSVHSLTSIGDFNNSGSLSLNGTMANGAAGFVGGNFDNGVGASLSVSTGNTSPTDSSSLGVAGVFNNSGSVFVEGFGSRLGTGDFINNGGSVTVGVFGSLGTNNFNNNGGSLTVNGNSVEVQISGDFNNSSGGSLTIEGGFSTQMSVLGAFNNNGGTVIMSGNGDTLTTSGLLKNSGSIAVGSTETLNAAGGYAQNGGSTDISGTLTTSSYKQTAGTTTIETGGLITSTTFTATGGTVTVNGILDPTAVEIGSGATLLGTGAINGNLAMGGTIVPGSMSNPGTFTVNGNYEQIGSGTFDELIGGASSNGLLDVNGDVTLDSGSMLAITLLGGFNPLGDNFTIMDYNSFLGEFSNGSSFAADGFNWSVNYGPNDIVITAVSTTPEPSTILLLGTGIVGLGCYTKRKRASAWTVNQI